MSMGPLVYLYVGCRLTERNGHYDGNAVSDVCAFSVKRNITMD